MPQIIKAVPLAALLALAGCSSFSMNAGETKTIDTQDGVVFTLNLERDWVQRETEIRYQARTIAQDFCTSKGTSVLPKSFVSHKPDASHKGARVTYIFECVGYVEAPPDDGRIHHLGYYKSEESKAETIKEIEAERLEDQK